VNIADTCRTEGLRSALGTDLESLTYAGRKVAAIVNREPLSFGMEDAGFSLSEPVTIEVFKGTAASKETVSIDGVDVPWDLRGVIPKNQDPVLLDNVNREVSKVQNCGTAWLITTIKSN
jgi:hypothetical protein